MLRTVSGKISHCNQKTAKDMKTVPCRFFSHIQNNNLLRIGSTLGMIGIIFPSCYIGIGPTACLAEPTAAGIPDTFTAAPASTTHGRRTSFCLVTCYASRIIRTCIALRFGGSIAAGAAGRRVTSDISGYFCIGRKQCRRFACAIAIGTVGCRITGDRPGFGAVCRKR